MVRLVEEEGFGAGDEVDLGVVGVGEGLAAGEIVLAEVKFC